MAIDEIVINAHLQPPMTVLTFYPLPRNNYKIMFTRLVSFKLMELNLCVFWQMPPFFYQLGGLLFLACFHIFSLTFYREYVTKEKCANCYSTKFLLVHHIDFDRTDNDPQNLKVLCKSCHQTIHDAFLNFSSSS